MGGLKTGARALIMVMAPPGLSAPPSDGPALQCAGPNSCLLREAQ